MMHNTANNTPSTTEATPSTACSRYYSDRPPAMPPACWLIAGYLEHRRENTPAGTAPIIWPTDRQRLADLLGVSRETITRYLGTTTAALGIETRRRGKATLIIHWPKATRPTGKHSVITAADMAGAGRSVTRAAIITAARLSREHDRRPASLQRLATITGTDRRTVTAALTAAGVFELHDHPAKPSAKVKKQPAKPSGTVLSPQTVLSPEAEPRPEHGKPASADPKPETRNPSDQGDKAHPLPASWAPTAASVRQLQAEGFTGEQLAEGLTTFRAHWIADTGTRKPAHWGALFVGWMHRRRHWKRLQAASRSRAGNGTPTAATRERAVSEGLSDRTWAQPVTVAPDSRRAWMTGTATRSRTVAEGLSDRTWAAI